MNPGSQIYLWHIHLSMIKYNSIINKSWQPYLFGAHHLSVLFGQRITISQNLIMEDKMAQKNQQCEKGSQYKF